jgi:CRP-like cAMP-binding protein
VDHFLVGEIWREENEHNLQIRHVAASTPRVNQGVQPWVSQRPLASLLDTVQFPVAIHVVTHEEMAQMIGSSRETVTRLLSELKKKEFIRLDGSTLVIRNRTALEALAA